MTEAPIAPPRARVACVGCGGLVPDIGGPVHRYMTASPGCWQAYTGLLGGGLAPSQAAALTVDAYAVTHPGVPGPQSTPSVWIHLLTLCFILERRWPVEQAYRLRRVAADSFDRWPWLTPPDAMGEVTAIDVASALAEGDGAAADALTRSWVDAAWGAWHEHRAVVRTRADAVAGQLG